MQYFGLNLKIANKCPKLTNAAGDDGDEDAVVVAVAVNTSNIN